MLSHLISDRRGISKTIFIAVIVGVLISLLSAGILFSPGLFRVENILDDNSQVVLAQAYSDVVNLSDALEDLENSGCTIVNVTEAFNYGDGTGFLLEYNEFRKAALRQKMVFLLDYGYYKSSPILTTSYNDFVLVWRPPEPDSKPEPTGVGALSLDTASATSTQITAWIRNTGTKNLYLDQAYVGGAPQALGPGNTSNPLLPGDVKKIVITGIYASGLTYKVKLVAKDNTQLSFSVLIDSSPGYEQVEIRSAWSVISAGTGWTITLELKNSGSAPATLDMVFINEVPLNYTGYGLATFPAGTDRCGTSISSTGSTLESGESATFYIWINQGYRKLTSGTTINIKLHSAVGMDYIKLVELV